MLPHLRRHPVARIGRAAVVLAAIALGLAAPAAHAEPGDHKYVTLRGRVADAAGTPLADVRVEASGTREAIALTNADGRFTLSLGLGTLQDLQRHPAYVSVRSRLAGYRVRVAGGAPELAFEVRVGAEGGAPVMQARSNFEIIADALLGALASPGDRTAVLQLRFVAEPGAERDSAAVVPEGRRSVPIAEPWLVSESPARPAPAVRAPAAPAPPPAEKPAATAPPAAARPSPPARVPAPAADRSAAPAPNSRESEQQKKIAAAQAARDSIWRAHRAEADARKVVMDSLRAVREAAEDSARRARFGLPPRPPGAPAIQVARPAKTTAAKPPRAPKPKQPPRAAVAREERAAPALVVLEPAPAPAKRAKPGPGPPARTGAAPRPTAPPYAPTVGGTASTSGLQRIEPHPDTALPEGSDAGTRARLEADTCSCVVKGTIELEFSRLLTSPLRIEVAIRELPALRDTIELFMGSPRAFEMRRVPCGRWSLALRPFSERLFGVITPEEVAPFDCRQRGLRQVRIVVAPLRPGR